MRDRAQQVRLADTGGPTDEEGVVCVAGHLGDGQGGGVGEPVAVTDNELIEGELGVPRPVCRRSTAAGAVAPGPGSGTRWAAELFGPVRAAGWTDHARLARAVVATAGQELDECVGADPERGAGLQQAP